MKKTKTSDLVTVSLCAALMCVCSWIQFPSAVPFTLQTFAVFLTATAFGTKKSLLSTLIYILLGAVGLPVFSGFQGGVGALVGPTGGFILGFIPAVLVIGFLSEKVRRKFIPQTLCCVAGLVICYLTGFLCYGTVYANGNFRSAFFVCILPFIISDILKILLAVTVSQRIRKIINK